MPITLPTRFQLDLNIKFEVMPEYCEDYRQIGHQKGKCRKSNAYFIKSKD